MELGGGITWVAVVKGASVVPWHAREHVRIDGHPRRVIIVLVIFVSSCQGLISHIP
jgi:hypothetical protein